MKDMDDRALPRLIAFYLPQFHPIPENDGWWGPGFTEWTNVAPARPQFPGHVQPQLPGELGFYDLRVPEVRESQATLAREHGIHGFCYYHYWFNGRRLLGRPLDELLASRTPDLPFCLCWANEDWTRAWDGREGERLIRQRYSEQDDLDHVRWLARVFLDDRYIRVRGRPLFLLYRALLLPDPARTIALWREEARRLGVGELFLCRIESFGDERGDPRSLGFDAAVEFQPSWPNLGPPLRRSKGWRALRRVGLSHVGYARHRVHDYASVVERMLDLPPPEYPSFPCVTPSWDNTPRRASGGVVLKDSTPDAYARWLSDAMARVADKADGGLVFINAWNEWAEGNYLEPSRRWGRAYLEATRSVMREMGTSDPVGSSPRSRAVDPVAAARGGRQGRVR